MTPPLTGWSNFYVIVGSASGALIGLQFVAISLISDIGLSQNAAEAGHAFATPTIVHFCLALALAALGVVPWPTMTAAGIAWAVVGGLGLMYSFIVVRRMVSQSAYRPELEDWIFHAALPPVAYALLAEAAWDANRHTTIALASVAAAALLLLFIGIHNAWDAVTYHIFVVQQKRAAKKKEAPKPEPT